MKKKEFNLNINNPLIDKNANGIKEEVKSNNHKNIKKKYIY